MPCNGDFDRTYISAARRCNPAQDFGSKLEAKRGVRSQRSEAPPKLWLGGCGWVCRVESGLDANLSSFRWCFLSVFASASKQLFEPSCHSSWGNDAHQHSAGGDQPGRETRSPQLSSSPGGALQREWHQSVGCGWEILL